MTASATYRDIQIRKTTTSDAGSCNFCDRDAVAALAGIQMRRDVFEFSGNGTNIRICRECLVTVKRITEA